LTIGVVNTGTAGRQDSPATSLTVQHVLQTSAAANAYRMVLVGVTGFGNGVGSFPSSVTYNGMPMTLAQGIAPANEVSASIYYILGANLPAAAGTYPVLVTSSGNNSFQLAADVIELTNVEQATNPIDAVGGEASSQNCSSHQPSDAVSVTVAGDFVYSLASVYGPITGTTAPTLQTITQISGPPPGNLGTFAGYFTNVAVGSRTVSWNDPACSASAHALASIKPTITP
jgi:hypothetical protein